MGADFELLFSFIFHRFKPVDAAIGLCRCSAWMGKNGPAFLPNPRRYSWRGHSCHGWGVVVRRRREHGYHHSVR
jgi:hypothetical protein